MRRSIIALITALALLAAACGGSDDEPVADAGAGAEAGSAEDTDATGADDASSDDSSDDGDASAADETSDDEGAADDDTADDADDTASDDEADTGSTEGLAAGRIGDRINLDDAATPRTGRFEGVLELSGVPELPTEGAEIVYTGAYSLDQEASELTLDFGTLLSEMAEDAGPFAAAFEEPIQIITIGDTAYLKWGLFGLFTGQEDAWIRTDATEAEGMTSGFTGFGAGSPTDFLDALAEADAEITEVGTETIRGVETTHLMAEVDFATLSERLDAEQQADLEMDLGDLPEGPQTFEFWVDGDDLLRRYRLEVTEIEGAEGGSVAITVELFDYDTDISIEEPPADQVVDGEGLGLDGFDLGG